MVELTYSIELPDEFKVGNLLFRHSGKNSYGAQIYSSKDVDAKVGVSTYDAGRGVEAIAFIEIDGERIFEKGASFDSMSVQAALHTLVDSVVPEDILYKSRTKRKSFNDMVKSIRKNSTLDERLYLGNTLFDVDLSGWGYDEVTSYGSEDGKVYYGLYIDDDEYPFDFEVGIAMENDMYVLYHNNERSTFSDEYSLVQHIKDILYQEWNSLYKSVRKSYPHKSSNTKVKSIRKTAYYDDVTIDYLDDMNSDEKWRADTVCFYCQCSDPLFERRGGDLYVLMSIFDSDPEYYFDDFDMHQETIDGHTFNVVNLTKLVIRDYMGKSSRRK